MHLHFRPAQADELFAMRVMTAALMGIGWLSLSGVQTVPVQGSHITVTIKGYLVEHLSSAWYNWVGAAE